MSFNQVQLTLNQTTQLRNTVDSWVAEGKSFTAFDVTTHVSRKLGYVPHSLARPEIHGRMYQHVQSGRYSRKADLTKGGANVYSPVRVSAPVKKDGGFKPTVVKAVTDNPVNQGSSVAMAPTGFKPSGCCQTSNTKSVKTVTFNDTLVKSNHRHLGLVNVDFSSNRLNLNSKHLKAIGSPNYVRVVLNQNTLIVRPESPSNCGKSGVYAVDKLNVKIRPHKFGLNGRAFNVALGNSGELLITKAA